MICRSIALYLVSIIYILSPAESKALSQDQMKLIEETAHRICSTGVSAKGRKTESQITGEITAELNALAKKLADAGLKGSVSTRSETFEGVPREAIAEVLQGDRRCRENLSGKMLDLAREADAGSPTTTNKSVPDRHPADLPKRGTARSMIGKWYGSIECQYGSAYAIILTIDNEAGDTGMGALEWTGRNQTKGNSNVILSSRPDPKDPTSNTYFASKLIQYPYNIKRISTNKMAGQSTTSNKCAINLERQVADDLRPTTAPSAVRQ